jgi:hypothetical protein
MPQIGNSDLRLLALLEESILARLLRLFILGEVARLAGLPHNTLVHTLQIYLCRGRDNISCVDPSQGNAIDFERTRDEEDTLLEVLQENDALSAEATSEEDDNSAGSERRADLGGADGLASLKARLENVQCDFQHHRRYFIRRMVYRAMHHERPLPMLPSLASTLSSLVHTFLGTATSSAG